MLKLVFQSYADGVPFPILFISVRSLMLMHTRGKAFSLDLDYAQDVFHQKLIFSMCFNFFYLRRRCD